MLKSILAFFVLSLLLAGCDQSAQKSKPVSQQPQPSTQELQPIKRQPPQPSTKPIELSLGTVWSTVTSKEPPEAGEGNEVRSVSDGVVIRSNFEELPTAAGSTGGSYFTLDSATEEALSGKKIRIDIKATGYKEATDHKFAVAYSTNAVGNSGWKEFSPTSKLASYHFEYEVPEDDKKGSGNDYIGILSDLSGKGSPVAIHEISVSLSK